MKYAITILLLLASCNFRASQGFELVGRLSEQMLCTLLDVESIRKDSLVVGKIVPRAHCRKVLGKTLNRWVTAKGASIVDKQDLYIALEWEVLQDTSKVRLVFTRIKR